MEFRRLRKRKEPNYKRSFVLIFLLIVVILLWFSAEDIMSKFEK